MAWPAPTGAQQPDDANAGALSDISLLRRIWAPIFARPPATQPRTIAAALRKDEAAAARVLLGRALFSDSRLSGDGKRACTTCHQPSRVFTDGLAVARGIHAPLKRNTPSVLNLGWSKHFYWDGRMATLAAQARAPIEHPNEMAGRFPTIIARLRQDATMRQRFAAAFSTPPSISQANILTALEAFQATLVTPDTRFEAWMAGADAALNAQEQTGFRLFVGKAGCVACHVGWRFTDDRFRDIGVSGDDPGRGAVPGGTPGLAAFKTPGLRRIAQTAPYMHNGSLADLAAVIDHYAGGFARRRTLDPQLLRSLTLSPAEKRALIAFLKAL
ncbi:MAG: cytochrome c peroxidase [Pseudomonadota bacterium]